MYKHYIILLAFLSILFGQNSMLDLEDVTNAQLDDIREQLKTDPSADTRKVLDPKIETLAIEIDREAEELERELEELSEYFGYNYFKRKINFCKGVNLVKFIFEFYLVHLITLNLYHSSSCPLYFPELIRFSKNNWLVTFFLISKEHHHNDHLRLDHLALT